MMLDTEAPLECSSVGMFRGSQVAVVIPAFNEADKIAATIRSVPGFVDHIIVVDDGSADGTARVAQRMARRALGRGSRRSIEVLIHAAQPRRRRGDRDRATRARSSSAPTRPRSWRATGRWIPPTCRGCSLPVVERRRRLREGESLRVARRLARDAARAPDRQRGALVADAAWRRGTRHCSIRSAGTRRRRGARCWRSIPTRMFARYGYPNDLLARLRVAGARVVDVPVRPVYGAGVAIGDSA